MFSNLLRQQARLTLSLRVSSSLSRHAQRSVLVGAHRSFSISRALSQEAPATFDQLAQAASDLSALDVTSVNQTKSQEYNTQGNTPGSFRKPRILHLGNLSWSVEENDIREAFSTYGPIRRIELVTNSQGQQNGRAYIEFRDEEDAARVLDSGNEEPFVINERVIRIEPAKGLPRQWRRGPGQPNNTIHIPNYPVPGDEASVLALLHNFSKSIQRVHFMKDADGNPTSKVFVTLKDLETAEKVMATFEGHELAGTKLNIYFATQRRRKSPESSNTSVFDA